MTKFWASRQDWRACCTRPHWQRVRIPVPYPRGGRRLQLSQSTNQGEAQGLVHQRCKVKPDARCNLFHFGPTKNLRSKINHEDLATLNSHGNLKMIEIGYRTRFCFKKKGVGRTQE
ncbi:hypothetical protein NPIL_12101 [Nephila pilipes]|uniref:Uncharacterized protein n=1 Tax=Nephila pilipes TaxID=299642 RepID=A0A8X6QTN8_NEPPI|nr:hypothetical protein NPIL_12101 [Nephila pilipes]